MTIINEIYKCNLCGNIAQVLHSGDGELVCCGQPMERLAEQTADASTEKHVPVIEKTEHGYNVKVGNITHPMEEKHYIEWIELIADGISFRKFLKPGDEPKASFCIESTKVFAREFCNIHGLWKGE